MPTYEKLRAVCDPKELATLDALGKDVSWELLSRRYPNGAQNIHEAVSLALVVYAKLREELRQRDSRMTFILDLDHINGFPKALFITAGGKVKRVSYKVSPGKYFKIGRAYMELADPDIFTHLASVLVEELEKVLLEDTAIKAKTEKPCMPRNVVPTDKVLVTTTKKHARIDPTNPLGPL